MLDVASFAVEQEKLEFQGLLPNIVLPTKVHEDSQTPPVCHQLESAGSNMKGIIYV